MVTRKGQGKGPSSCWDMHPLTLLLFAAFLPTVRLTDWKALDEFVNLPDPHYKYTFVNKISVPISPDWGAYVHNIKMTSQKWLDESEVDKPVWTHELLIHKQLMGSIKKKNCLLVILPDQNDKIHTKDIFMKSSFGTIATKSRSVVAVLRRTLPQPLTFYNDPLGRKNIKGYDIVALSWWDFLNNTTASADRLVQFPMVKAVVRAMDTITDYVRKTFKADVTEFTLVGLGLGGWISWLTAAVDKRVKSIAPIAMDFLNFTESFKHHYRAYCGWSYMMKPFYDMNITQELDNPRFQELASHVDPLEYNERYANVIKYIIILTGDEFFPPDNTRFYFSQLEGTNHLLIMQNTDYENLLDNGLMARIRTFYIKIVEDGKLPQVSWETKMTNTSETITLTTYDTLRVYIQQADTPDDTRRDFRMKRADGNSFKKTSVNWIRKSIGGRFVYTAEISSPPKGWRGFFIEVLYTLSGKDDFAQTSEMLVVPDTYPCPDCYGDECRGTIV